MMSSPMVSSSQFVCLETLGNLILDELKLIRIEMKEEVRKLGKEIKQLYIDGTKQSNLSSGLNSQHIREFSSSSFMNHEHFSSPSGVDLQEKAKDDGMSLTKKNSSNQKATLKSTKHSLDDVVDILKNQALIVKQEANVNNFVDSMRDYHTSSTHAFNNENNLFEVVGGTNESIAGPAFTSPELLSVKAQSEHCNILSGELNSSNSSISTSVKDASAGAVLQADMIHGGVSAISFNGFAGASSDWANCMKQVSEFLPTPDHKSTAIVPVGDISPNFLCKFCMKPFRHFSSYKSHLRSHTGEKPFKCNICDKLFSQKCYLKRHMHWHSSEKPFVCEICDKGFVDKGNLKTHLRTHTGEKPFVCSICNKRFSQKSGLTQHILLHKNIKPHVCFVCDKRFLQKSGLTAHLASHTGEKPFQCNVCHKAFALKTYLTQHMRLHNDEKPFACYMCNKTFGQKAYLNAHIARHNNSTVFGCDICKKSFKKQIYLLAHKQIHNM